MKNIIVCVLIIMTACGQVTGNAVQEESISFGYIGPLSGDLAAFGEEEQHAIELAVEDINARGGIDGRRLDVIYEDGKCDGKTAANAARKLVNVNRVNIILGGLCSSETLAAAPITEANEVILFSSLSSSPAVTEAGDYVFRNSYSDTDAAAATARFAIDEGIRTMAVLAENTDYAMSFAQVFSETFESMGGKVLLTETYRDTPDFRTSALKLMTTGSDAVLISPQDMTGGLAAKQLRELGYTGILYGNLVLYESGMEDYGTALEGLRYTDLGEIRTEAALSLERRYEEKYGQVIMRYLVAARYDAVRVLADAIESKGRDTARIRDYLYEVEYTGALGTNRFDENGDVIGIRFENMIVENGEAKQIH